MTPEQIFAYKEILDSNRDVIEAVEKSASIKAFPAAAGLLNVVKSQNEILWTVLESQS